MTITSIPSGYQFLLIIAVLGYCAGKTVELFVQQVASFLTGRRADPRLPVAWVVKEIVATAIVLTWTPKDVPAHEEEST